MSKGLIFDIETNGLLDAVTKVHCIAIRDEEGGEVRSFGGAKIRNFLSHMEEAPFLIGHNILDFDLRALKKVYPAFTPRGMAWDTLLDSQVIWTNLRDLDFSFSRKHPEFPKNLIGRHSLEAWGHRLGEHKGTFGNPDDPNRWAVWTEEMEAYCRQDVVVTVKFYEKILANAKFSRQAHDIEMEFKSYMLDQETEGFPFDEASAKKLYVELAAERAEVEKGIEGIFPPWEKRTTIIPKRSNKTRGYVAGVPFTKTKMIAFNPRSHSHIADRMIAQRGWVPDEFTEAGKPTTDDDVLQALAKDWPECGLLAKHVKIQKIIGMVAEGKSAYLKLVSPDGRLRGRVGTCGTVTGRCSHKEPNLGNIPRRGTYGKLVRKLFTAIPGFSLVGSDAKGLELRMLAHFLARFDGGKYVLIVVDGDPHEYHRELAGLALRDDAKTFIYGFIYGAGDGKIGLIIGKGKAAGRKLKLTFLRKFPALNYLKNAVAAKAKTEGFITGLDGRKLYIRAVYSSLNSLLQSSGALVMKMAVIFFNREIRARGWHQRGDVRQVAFVHDEIQSLVRNGLEEEVKQLGKDSIKRAGEFFKLRCPTDGDSKSGANWGETH